jgi:endo-1,4-beta-mannosidase
MRFRLGINYWPITSAMRWWQRFDAGEVERDFALIRAAGFDSVRLFLLWEDFQPAPDEVAAPALANLVRVADSAKQHQLQLVPTLFTGHMSGANWAPAWAIASGESSARQRFRVVSGGRVLNARLTNWYTDARIMEAQANLARAVAAALGEHPALWAYDLGNENSNCVVPPSRAAASAWLETMAGAIRSVDTIHPITIGLHMEDLEEDRGLTPAEAAQVCDFLCMHGYPLYADWARDATDELALVFLGLITRWLGGKAVLFEEFGAPTRPRDNRRAEQLARQCKVTLLDEETAAQFTRRALAALRHFGFTGAMLWCFGDYSEAIWDEPPLDEALHERFFGLWRSDHSPKPALVEINEMSGAEQCERADDFAWIDVAREEFYQHPRANLRRLYQSFLRRLD